MRRKWKLAGGKFTFLNQRRYKSQMFRKVDSKIGEMMNRTQIIVTSVPLRHCPPQGSFPGSSHTTHFSNSSFRMHGLLWVLQCRTGTSRGGQKSATRIPKVGPESAKRRLKVYPKSIQSRSKVDPKSARSRCKVDPKVAEN